MISTICRIKCSESNTSRAVCIEPSCCSYPFVCNHDCECQLAHEGHQQLQLDDFHRIITQSPQFSQDYLSDWCEVYANLIRSMILKLTELQVEHKQWFEGFIKGYLREQETYQVYVGGTDKDLAKLTGRKMRRLFEERTKSIEMPFAYNFPKEKWYFVETIKPQMDRKCQQLIQELRKYFDCKVELRGIMLNHDVVIERLSDPQIDTILIHNCKFENSQEFGWPETVNVMAGLKYLRKLRISECGIASTIVQKIAASLTQVIDLDLRANSIDRNGAHSIASMKGLVYLNLSYNNTGDQGAYQIVSNLQTLRVLSLSINNISSDMSSKLRDLIPFTVDLYL